MAEQKALYIAGNWVTTADTVVNTNPSDTHDVIGEPRPVRSMSTTRWRLPTARWVSGACHPWRPAIKCSWPLVTS